MNRLLAGLGAIALAVAAPVAAQAPAILIEGVTVIDGTGRAPMPNASVLIQGDRIASVSAGAITPPAGATRIDGRGKYLIPGLIDVHIHLQGSSRNERQGIQALHGFLYSGFTTVFDAGNDPDYIFGLRARERAGTLVSPRILATGPLVTTPGGPGARSTSTLITSWPGAIPLLDKHLAMKPDMVKFTFDEHGWGTRPLIPLLDSALMSKAAHYIEAHGVRTTVHISHEYRARQAIGAGLTTLAHPIIQGPISKGFVDLMVQTQTPMASTLTIGEGYSRLVEHPEFLDRKLYRDVYDSATIHRMKTTLRDEYAARAWTTWMKVMTPVAQENVREIHAAGGIIALGSDQSSGPSSHRELELMVNGGISTLDAIKIGTHNSAVFLGKEADLGTIERGKLADLVLLDADPVQDIRNTEEIAMVIKGGQVVDRSKLDLPVNHAHAP